jgi:hypothetical protein
MPVYLMFYTLWITKATNTHSEYTVKVKESRNRPGVAQRVPGDLGSQIFMTLGT